MLHFAQQPPVCAVASRTFPGTTADRSNPLRSVPEEPAGVIGRGQEEASGVCRRFTRLAHRRRRLRRLRDVRRGGSGHPPPAGAGRRGHAHPPVPLLRRDPGRGHRGHRPGPRRSCGAAPDRRAELAAKRPPAPRSDRRSTGSAPCAVPRSPISKRPARWAARSATRCSPSSSGRRSRKEGTPWSTWARCRAGVRPPTRVRHEVIRLKRMLSELVETERFEEAAGVRDRLADLARDLQEDGR